MIGSFLRIAVRLACSIRRGLQLLCERSGLWAMNHEQEADSLRRFCSGQTFAGMRRRGPLGLAALAADRPFDAVRRAFMLSQ